MGRTILDRARVCLRGPAASWRRGAGAGAGGVCWVVVFAATLLAVQFLGVWHRVAHGPVTRPALPAVAVAWSTTSPWAMHAAHAACAGDDHAGQDHGADDVPWGHAHDSAECRLLDALSFSDALAPIAPGRTSPRPGVQASRMPAPAAQARAAPAGFQARAPPG
jgi:hypothetical protein